jgi:hypothetical protein
MSPIFTIPAVLIVTVAADIFVVEPADPAGKAVILDESPWTVVRWSPVPAAIVENIVTLSIIDNVVRTIDRNIESERRRVQESRSSFNVEPVMFARRWWWLMDD